MHTSRISYIALAIAYMVILWTSFFYYPKWDKGGSEATIGWDASGYYWYLPAFLIYDDPKQLDFSTGIYQQYAPTPDIQQYFDHDSGSKVMKYSSGMALQYLPFFGVAHALAPTLGYPADGFSRPYQFAIQFGSVLFCFVGLWYLRKVLKAYFPDSTVAAVIVLYVLGTNYLNYAAIDGAMTHNWLFSWYAILLWVTHRYHIQPTFSGAAKMGLTLGIMALTRPTELLAVIIPLFWTMSSFQKEVIWARARFLWAHRQHLALTVGTMISVGFIQLLYWRYVSGDWIVYSYQDQGFSWFSPHFKNFIFSFRTGWLIYTPMMIFAFLGVYALIKSKIHTVPLLLFFFLNLYIVCAWDAWSYGARAMVQGYAVMAFPFAAWFASLSSSNIKRFITWPAAALFLYLNIWWTHQIHLGGMVDAFNMTQAYYWRIAGRFDIPWEAVKLMDTDELYEGNPKAVQTLFQTDFEQDSTYRIEGAIVGQGSEWVSPEKRLGASFDIPFSPENKGDWIRAEATFFTPERTWDIWKMPYLNVQFVQSDNEIVKHRRIKLHRHLEGNEAAQIHLDVRIPDDEFDRIVVFMDLQETGQRITYMDDLRVSSFQE